MNGASASTNFAFNPNFECLWKVVSDGFMYNTGNHEYVNKSQPGKTLFDGLLTRVKSFVTNTVRLVHLTFSACWNLQHWNYSRFKIYETDICRNEFRKVHLLENRQIKCGKCNDRIGFCSIFGECYHCTCGIHEVQQIRMIHSDDWVPLIDIGNTAMWRKRFNENTERYLYKIKGYIENISARDFLRTLMDVEYRLKWDKTTLELSSARERNSKYEIIYWRIRWPPPHLSRDYVYHRRYGRLNRYGIYIVQSNSILHPSYPERNNIVRVKNYRSILAINPLGDFKCPGMKYCLLYYEDPGEPYTLEMLTWFFKEGLKEFTTSLENSAVVLPKSRRRMRELFDQKEDEETKQSEKTRNQDEEVQRGNVAHIQEK